MVSSDLSFPLGNTIGLGSLPKGTPSKPLTLGALMMGLGLNDLANDIYLINKSKGWHDKERTALENHMLIVTEVAEATEEVRNGKSEYYLKNGKPEGEAAEIADVIIRCLDYSMAKKWDIEKIVNEKLAYNKTRSYRHGNKVI